MNIEVDGNVIFERLDYKGRLAEKIYNCNGSYVSMLLIDSSTMQYILRVVTSDSVSAVIERYNE